MAVATAFDDQCVIVARERIVVPVEDRLRHSIL
jgi:hypothetical protein